MAKKNKLEKLWHGAKKDMATYFRGSKEYICEECLKKCSPKKRLAYANGQGHAAKKKKKAAKKRSKR